jgi:23S rRNA-/tRNA-specific pseudouridylate synthase
MLKDSSRNEDYRWEGCHEAELPNGCVLQLQGIGSPTRTAFGRIVARKSGRNRNPSFYSVKEMLEFMVREIRRQRQAKETDISAEELLSLGSVWRLKKDHRTEKWRPTRLLHDNVQDKFNSEGEESLRVHYYPSRFPAVRSVLWVFPAAMTTQCTRKNSIRAIHHYDSNLGFCVVYKPSGLPSHATVDNGVENVLYQIQQSLQDSFQESHACCLPQRLDIDTEGLLLVAVKPEFASFMGRLLQDKTMAATGSGNNFDVPSCTGQSLGLQKQYKCLVQVSVRASNDLLERRSTEGDVDVCAGHGAVVLQKDMVIQHYIDPKSPAPKSCVAEPKEGWLRCALRIIEIGSLQTWKEDHQKEKGLGPMQFMEMKVELLTGRTHQIRGQFAALNLPLVGDPLYVSESSEISWDETRNRGITCNPTNKYPLALQCCFLSFPKPHWGKHPRTKRPVLIMGNNRQEMCCFTLEKSWWSDLVQLAAPMGMY